MPMLPKNTTKYVSGAYNRCIQTFLLVIDVNKPIHHPWNFMIYNIAYICKNLEVKIGRISV